MKESLLAVAVVVAVNVDTVHAAIPSLLAVSAVHHHLISVGKRVQTALVVESGEIGW